MRRDGPTSDRIIVALDTADPRRFADLVKLLAGRVGMLKIGKELFTALGPAAVRQVRDEGGRVFLDLKFHDIPNTVAGAVRAATQLGVSLLTLHAAGGKAMLEAAREAMEGAAHRPALLAVTLLTSLDASDMSMLGLAGSEQEVVVRLARLARAAGIDGLVASARELQALRRELGDDCLLVTPGIRPAGSGCADQRRVASPAQAIQDGADYLVIGRPITEAVDPVAALEAIVQEIDAGRAERTGQER